MRLTARTTAATIAAGTVSALLAVLLLRSCATDADPPAALPTTTPSASGSSTASSPVSSATTSTPSEATTTAVVKGAEQQVLEAYLGMQRAFERAGATADPAATDLPQYATGAALTLLQSGLTSMRAKGLRGTGETIFNPTVEQLAPARNPTTARVRDCMDTTDARAFKVDDPTYQDTPGGRRLVIATVQLSSGGWKVSGLGVHEVGSCTG